jgi:hypothetical protein
VDLKSELSAIVRNLGCPGNWKHKKNIAVKRITIRFILIFSGFKSLKVENIIKCK